MSVKNYYFGYCTEYKKLFLKFKDNQIHKNSSCMYAKKHHDNMSAILSLISFGTTFEKHVLCSIE